MNYLVSRIAFFCRWFLLFAFACCTVGAHATVLSGNFSGEAANSTWLGMPDGTPITGNFYFDSSFGYQFVEGDGMTFAHYQTFNLDSTADPVRFTFGDMNVNGFGLLDVWLFDTAEGQAIRFSSYFIHGYGAELLLAGSDGSFFDGVDLGSLHVGTADLSRSLAHMAVHGGYENDVLLHALSLNAGTDVPEPNTAILVGFALAGLYLARRRHVTTPRGSSAIADLNFLRA